MYFIYYYKKLKNKSFKRYFLIILIIYFIIMATIYTLVNYLYPKGDLSCVNTRNTNLITIVRDVHLNPKGKLANVDILNKELQFLKNFYGVVKFAYVVLPDNVVQNYIENVDKLTEDELKVTKIIHGKDGDKEVTYQKKLIEVSRVNDGNEAHEVYLIKNALTKDMISDFMNEYPEMKPFDYTEAQPREIKLRVKKEKPDKEKPHVDGKKVTKNDDSKKDDGKKSAAKPKAAAAAKSKVVAAKGKKPAKKEEEPEPEPDDVEEQDDEIEDEENADE